MIPAAQLRAWLDRRAAERREQDRARREQDRAYLDAFIRDQRAKAVPSWAVEMGERLDRIEAILQHQVVPTTEIVRRLRALRVPDELIERDVYRRAGYSREEC